MQPRPDDHDHGLDVIYRDTRARVSHLLSTLADEQWELPVPATPQWTVHDLVAHLTGGAVDAATGRIDGAPGQAWTARHVDERRTIPAHQLLREWHAVGPVIEQGLAGQRFTGPNIAADLICHEADLHEALGHPRPAREHWQQPFLPVMMQFLRQRLKDCPTVLIRNDDGHEWHCGAGEPATVLEAESYELLRAMFSRRSRRQIATWNWTHAPAPPVIDSFGFFGPRDDDQPIPPPDGGQHG
ncbi:maleylpyruvate isomerase family mycothiol-dependent enzyme [Mycolicibacterium sp. CBM1]